MRLLPILDIASSLGASIQSQTFTWEQYKLPWQILSQAGLELQWHHVKAEHSGTLDMKMLRLNKNISQYTQKWTTAKRPFLVLGGDHSCAMGTWAGVLNAMHSAGQFGLIWLDAHLDAHTFSTSPSSNVHGMPIAALLGKADQRLAGLYPSRFFVEAEKLKLMGVRSYETEELDLLHSAKVQVVFANQINYHNNFKQQLLAAVRELSLSCQTIGISLDLDCIDPEDAPGVNTPVAKGVRALQLLNALQSINQHPKLCGLEVCEYNPAKDVDHKTLRLVGKVIAAVFGEINENKFLGSVNSGINENSVPR